VSAKKLILLTATVAILFTFIVFFERKMPSTADRERKGDLYWDIPVDQIERIELTRGAETLELQRVDAAHWKMARPEKYPADSSAVTSVASELAALKRAGSDTAEARPSDYGLEKPVATAALTWTDPDDPKLRKTRVLEFGSEVPGTDTVAARVASTQKVLFVPASVLTAVRKSTDDFASREVFGEPSADISRVEILRGRGRLSFVRKAGAWWLVEPLADLADSAETQRLVGSLTALRAREFVHGNVDLGAQGLNPPLFRVSVTDAKGAVTAVDFGATRSDGNAVYAQREKQVLIIDREIVDDLSKEAVAFRSPQLVDYDRSDVSALEGTFGQVSLALSQKDGGWSSQGHPILAPDADDLESAILGLKSQAFLDEGELQDLGPPAATVTVKRKVGSPWIVTLHPHGGATAAKVSSRPGGFRLEANAAGQLEAAFRKAIAPPPAKATPGVRKP
jgi:uncharacterized protein DUF4340